MTPKEVLKEWIVEALGQLGGEGSVVNVSKVVWQEHEAELRASGDLFFTWQYDLRWAAQILRDRGVLASLDGRRDGIWRKAEVGDLS